MTFKEELKKEFEEETRDIVEMESNGPEIFKHKLNYQQRLIVQMLKKVRDNGFLNYSGTGAGKTKAAIASAYYLGAKHTLIFCPNQVKSTWKRQILEANFVDEDNVVIDSIISCCDDVFTFEIFNYEKFNTDGRASKRIKDLLDSKEYGLVVFDEVHRLKNKNTETYKQLFKLVNTLREVNSDVKVLGNTATPMTTSISDLQGIYELLSGKKADELTMGTHATRLINGNMTLESIGTGLPQTSVLTVRYNDINSDCLFKAGQNGKEIFNTPLAKINGNSIVKDCIRYRGNVSKIEELHLKLKFDAYNHLVKKGTVIYTEYTYGDRILMYLKDLVEDQLHLSACIYSGGCKETDDGSHSIDVFESGKKDVLIGTKSMCEGIDSLQMVSNRVILHTVPSVWSVMYQLIGRFDRQGSNFVDKGVDVYVPMVVFYLEDGTTTSFDKRRWKFAMYRKVQDDIIKGRHIEKILDSERNKMIDEVIEKLKGKYVMTEVERERIQTDGIGFDEVEWERKQSLISEFNRKGKLMNSSRFHREIISGPDEWFEYHKARHESMKTWNEIPYEHIASMIKNKNKVVADFGCGENLMRTFIPENEVYSLDHIAIDDTVIACDMAHTPLADQSVDIAVFSLSLWGSNYEDYFIEAYRVLSYDGLLYIAEPTKSYDETKRKELVDKLKKHGFTMVGDIESRGKFFYLKLMK